MHRFRNILVVCEEHGATDRALERVRWLASSNGAAVTLLTVPEQREGELARLLSSLPGSAAPQELDASIAAVHRDRLDRLAAPLIEAGLEVSVEVQGGTAFLEAIRLVLARDIDLVVKGAGPVGARSLLRGLDMHLLRKCPCPVWIVKEDAPATSARILAAVDPDPEDVIRDGLNRLVLQLATSLAEADGARVDVLNVWRLQEEAALRHSLVKIPVEEVERIVEAEERQSAWRLDRLMKDFAGFSDRMRVHHRKGVASEMIPRFAEDQGVDTIVMGTIARTGMKGFFIGNTAETILGAVTCSVLTVKPEGFVSPVELET